MDHLCTSKKVLFSKPLTQNKEISSYANFQQKNLIGHKLWKLSNFVYYIKFEIFHGSLLYDEIFLTKIGIFCERASPSYNNLGGPSCPLPLPHGRELG